MLIKWLDIPLRQLGGLAFHFSFQAIHFALITVPLSPRSKNRHRQTFKKTQTFQDESSNIPRRFFLQKTG